MKVGADCFLPHREALLLTEMQSEHVGEAGEAGCVELCQPPPISDD